MIRVAPLGDPVESRIRDTSLSIRANEVSVLLLARLSAALTLAIIGNPVWTDDHGSAYRDEAYLTVT